MLYTKYEPPIKRRLRIKSKVRLIVSLIFILFALSLILMPKHGTSNVNWKPYRVHYGDTYWEIAKELQKAGYRSRADIRDVAHELIQMSGIPAHQLKEGDVILIPNIENYKEGE